MNNLSIVALFCEDIREERGGTETIVGVLPDNLIATRVPGVFPKMCVYVRMHIRLEFEVDQISVRVLMPDGAQAAQSYIQPQLIEQAREQARASGSPNAGLITKFILSPMRITQAGRIQAVVNVGDDEFVVGGVTVQLAPQKS